jgi:hypothetical protein
VDAKEVNEQAELLRANGLDVLNTKVLMSPSAEVLDVIAEHNMAAVLARRQFRELQPELPSTSRPVDFVGVQAGHCYRIEVKRLGASEHEDLHSSVMQTVNIALESDAQRALTAARGRSLSMAKVIPIQTVHDMLEVAAPRPGDRRDVALAELEQAKAHWARYGSRAIFSKEYEERRHGDGKGADAEWERAWAQASPNVRAWASHFLAGCPRSAKPSMDESQGRQLASLAPSHVSLQARQRSR